MRQHFFSPYVLCPKCNKVIVMEDFTRIAAPCPACGQAGYRQCWPDVTGQLWRDMIYNESLATPTQQNVASVVFCSAAEAFLEHTLREILLSQRAIYEHLCILLDTHDSYARKKELFKKLTGRSLKEACAKLGVSDFHAAWERTVEARNKFVHGGVPGRISKFAPHKKDLEVMRNGFDSSFALLHNNYAVGTGS